MVTAQERIAPLGEIELAYETFGDAANPAVLMIMGIGAQMIFWPEELCETLADRGYFVVRFDNRDVGRSTKLDGLAPPPLTAMLAGQIGEDTVPYRLAEMAADAVGLLDHLGIERAHVVGASMGGMIGQRVAIDHPERALSLASIMSTTGDRSVGQPTAAAVAVLMTAPPTDLEGYVESFLTARRTLGSHGFGFDEQRTRRLAERCYGRGYFPDGTARQFAAILASPDRTPELATIEAPTLVIHGEDDALIDVSGGRATAAAIAGSELVVIEGMGHDLPEGTWEPIAAAMIRNFQRAPGEG
jgi:pimeloyl-ACP methyl ester carboxylesterase